MHADGIGVAPCGHPRRKLAKSCFLILFCIKAGVVGYRNFLMVNLELFYSGSSMLFRLSS